MTAPMTMNRVIHAAVRRDLDRLTDALDRMQDGDLTRARALERAYANLRTELTHHHEGEDTHIWPMLATVGVDRHLQHEETELGPLLARHMETPEWRAVEKKLRSQPLPEAGRFFAWLTDGMTDENRAVLKRTVPSPVVTVLSRTFGRRYYKDVAPTWR